MATPSQIKFAKLMFGKSERLSSYKKIASLVGNGIPIDQALTQLYKRASKNGTKNEEPQAIVFGDIIVGIRNGKSLAESMRNWAPVNERMIISAGEKSGDLVVALRSVCEVSESSSKMMGAVMGSVLYPIALLAAAIGVLMMFGIKVIPMFAKVSNPEEWGGAAYSMYWVSEFVKGPWLWVDLGVLFAAVITIIVTLPTLRGPIRVKLDRIPPWSTYRIFMGSGFVLSLSALIKAGVPLQKALLELRANANPWLKERIDGGINGAKAGLNLGVAFDRAGHGFPDKEIIEELIIYSNQSGFDAALEIIGREWLIGGVKVVESQAAILNGVAKMLMGLLVAWIVYGTFALQNQIADSVQRMSSGGHH